MWNAPLLFSTFSCVLLKTLARTAHFSLFCGERSAAVLSAPSGRILLSGKDLNENLDAGARAAGAHSLQLRQ
jgi:hypothetical protein